jgi:hypothetical protein
MTITKGSYVSVKSKDGSTTKAIVDKVGPWSKNPKIILVNWTGIEIITDERGSFKVKGKTLLASCTEIPDPCASSDPIMAKWSLGKEKKGPMMMEGHYFASPLFLNGKRVGDVVDEGHGGCMTVQEKVLGISAQLHADCEAWEKKNNPHYSPHSESLADWHSWYQDERPQGKDAATYFKEQKETMDKWSKEAEARKGVSGK